MHFIIGKPFSKTILFFFFQDVADTVVSLLAAKPHVQIHDVIVRNVNEK